jgi:hypothetical protein
MRIIIGRETTRVWRIISFPRNQLLSLDVAMSVAGNALANYFDITFAGPPDPAL